MTLKEKLRFKREYRRVDKAFKKELKDEARRRKLYREKYDNQEGDPMVCGPLQFIWGHSEQTDGVASFETLNNIDVYYNRDEKKYYLDIETAYVFASKKNEVSYLLELLIYFKQYMKKQNIDSSGKELNLWTIADETDGLFRADTIEELYAKFAIFVYGYKQYYKSLLKE